MRRRYGERQDVGETHEDGKVELFGIIPMEATCTNGCFKEMFKTCTYAMSPPGISEET